MNEKLTVSLKLTRHLDQRLDEVAASLVDLVGRSSFNGQPNRSEVVRALIATCDPERLREYLLTQRAS